VALVTPFTGSAQVDEPALRRLVDWQISEGTNVILIAGTTGEGSALGVAEKERVFAVAVEQAAGRVPVLCNAGSNDTADAIALTEAAEKAGASGVLSVGPYYNKPTQEGYWRHFLAIAESTDLPIIIYNVPGRTGSNITAETTLRLAEIPNLVGTKEASGDLSQIMTILRRRPDGFLVLSGDDSFTYPLLALGADGVISVAANEAPRLVSEMTKAAVSEEWGKARELHFKLLPLMEINFVESNPIPVKAALAMMGLIEEEYRLPLVRIAERNRARLKEVLHDLELIPARANS
jgi:4-hydroxy-tetrahydrodipicolinate synthase